MTQTETEFVERKASLARMIETEIIPRLLLINREASATQGLATAFTAAETAEFGDLTLVATESDLHAHIQKLRERGHSVENLFVELLAPAARYLGVLWENDRCDFLDVTIAVGKLKTLMADLRSAIGASPLDARYRALLLSPAGEQHVFGLDVLGELLRFSGWEVAMDKGGDCDRQSGLVRYEWFGVCGVTASSTSALPAIALLIETLRRKSCNRKLSVLVGGRAFEGRRRLACEVGADAFAEDARTAVRLMSQLVSEQSARA